MSLIDKLNHYIENEDADADLYFDEFPPEQFKETLLKLSNCQEDLENAYVGHGKLMGEFNEQGLKLDAALLRLGTCREIVDRQAEDEGLWFEAQTAPEAYLQQELRKLHGVVEGTGPLHSADEPTNMDAMFRGWSKAGDVEGTGT